MESFEKYFKKVNSNIEYDENELKMGIEVEKEHTNDPEVAEIIAKHHLASNPKYYSDLEKSEIDWD